ncbi:MAG: 5-deoxy-glucuronate isomerase [Firmicutes bacterium]|nr:5-deoxy-glucuronate isomerase [Bacillota bacterium]
MFVTATGDYNLISANMDISFCTLKKGQCLNLFSETQETALLLISGAVSFNNESPRVRKSPFENSPHCIHFARGESLNVLAVEDSEILIQKTENKNKFETKIYTEENIKTFISCEGKWEDTAKRKVSHIFDYDNAPYSNMVLGEVIAYQGRWWSYPPHGHPQPEVYFYKFARKEGFGACFIGDTAHTIKDNSFAVFENGLTHAQVTAPGYPMYCAWLIRHIDGKPWKCDRIVDKNYKWLEE